MEKNKRLYSIWSGMKQRCNNPKSASAPWYHDKGIKVCCEWEHDFFAFQEWALQNGYKDDLTIDRIDADQDYKPDNCRWLTKSENSSRATKEKRHINQQDEQGKTEDSLSNEKTYNPDIDITELISLLISLAGMDADMRKLIYKTLTTISNAKAKDIHTIVELAGRYIEMCLEIRSKY